MRNRMTIAVAVAMAAGMLPVGAAEGDGPLISDAAGDANFLNSQGNLYAQPDPNGPDTRPASIDGADIREIDFSTTYRTEKILGPDGSVREVRHIPEALRVTVTMEGDVLPTFGPSLVVRIPATVRGTGGSDCDVSFQAWWRGPGAPEDHLHQADIRTFWACGGPGTLVLGFDLSIEGPVITMDYPLDAPGMSGFIEDGTRLLTQRAFGSDPPMLPFTALQTLWFPLLPPPGPYSEGPVTLGRIDETEPFPGFVVGSDVPVDVDCAAAPGHPACA